MVHEFVGIDVNVDIFSAFSIEPSEAQSIFDGDWSYEHRNNKIKKDRGAQVVEVRHCAGNWNRELPRLSTGDVSGYFLRYCIWSGYVRRSYRSRCRVSTDTGASRIGTSSISSPEKRLCGL